MQTQSAASLRRARVKPRVSLARSEIYGARHLSKLDYKRHICKDTPRLIFIYIKPCNSCGKMRLRTRRRPKAPAANLGAWQGLCHRRDTGGCPAGSGEPAPRGPGCAAPGTPEMQHLGWKVLTWREGGMERGRGARSAQPGGDAALGCEPTERRMTQNPLPTHFLSWQAPSPHLWVTQQDSQSHTNYLCMRCLLSLQSKPEYKPRRSPDNLIKDSLLQSTCR